MVYTTLGHRVNPCVAFNYCNYSFLNMANTHLIILGFKLNFLNNVIVLTNIDIILTGMAAAYL